MSPALRPEEIRPDVERVVDAMVVCPKVLGPDTTVPMLERFFVDQHVHLALTVGADGRLLTTLERGDLEQIRSGRPGAITECGTLLGRTVLPATRLETATARLKRQRRRRPAVVDDTGQLLGLLCLMRDGTGYCSDEGIRAREMSRHLSC